MCGVVLRCPKIHVPSQVKPQGALRGTTARRRRVSLERELPRRCPRVEGPAILSRVDRYPADAYAPGGELWWNLEIRPGTKNQTFGQTSRLAAWLWFNKSVGERFTMNELRAALGPNIVGKSEHLTAAYGNCGRSAGPSARRKMKAGRCGRTSTTSTSWELAIGSMRTGRSTRSSHHPLACGVSLSSVTVAVASCAASPQARRTHPKQTQRALFSGPGAFMSV
jgi:hypothetical protein